MVCWNFCASSSATCQLDRSSLILDRRPWWTCSARMSGKKLCSRYHHFHPRIRSCCKVWSAFTILKILCSYGKPSQILHLSHQTHSTTQSYTTTQCGLTCASEKCNFHTTLISTGWCPRIIFFENTHNPLHIENGSWYGQVSVVSREMSVTIPINFDIQVLCFVLVSIQRIKSVVAQCQQTVCGRTILSKEQMKWKVEVIDRETRRGCR